MSDEREANESDDAADDLELTDEDADHVRGGDSSPPVSNVLKTKHDTVKNSIGNIR